LKTGWPGGGGRKTWFSEAVVGEGENSQRGTNGQTPCRPTVRGRRFEKNHKHLMDKIFTPVWGEETSSSLRVERGFYRGRGH